MSKFTRGPSEESSSSESGKKIIDQDSKCYVLNQNYFQKYYNSSNDNFSDVHCTFSELVSSSKRSISQCPSCSASQPFELILAGGRNHFIPLKLFSRVVFISKLQGRNIYSNHRYFSNVLFK